jgi:uncharacterized protein involved in exopolysaccharide biosynthesis
MPNATPPGGSEARAKVTPSEPVGTSTASGGSYQNGGDVHLLDRVAVVYRYRAVAASLFILTTLAVVLQGYGTVPLYRATGRLLIEDERSTAIPGLETESQYWDDPVPYYNTQYKILQGRDLARKVVVRLQLHTVPEFNGTADPNASSLPSLRGLVRQLRGQFSAPPPAEPPSPVETPDEATLIDAFLARVSVEPVRDSRLVDVSFRALDAEFAAKAANALAEEYVAQNLAVKLESTANMLDWLGNELANLDFGFRNISKLLDFWQEKCRGAKA